MQIQKTLLFFGILFFGLGSDYLKAQLTIDDGLTAEEMVAFICGSGVTFSNASYTGAEHASGKFQEELSVNLGISEGVLLTSGDANTAIGPNQYPGGVNTNNNNMPGDPDLDNLLVGDIISLDASVLEFDFIPSSDTILLRYVFASEEYPDFVTSSYNDIFAFMVSGPNPLGGTYDKYNIALIPGTEQAVSIHNVNGTTNQEYYRSNHNASIEFPINVNYNGFTVVLTGILHVVACEEYHIKFAIGDGSPRLGSDRAYDSGVFLEANSFSSPVVNIDPQYSTPLDSAFAVEGCTQANVVFEIPETSPDTTWIYLDTIYGTAINGVDFPFVSDTLFIPPGENTDTMFIQPFYDPPYEGIETFIFEYDNDPCQMNAEVYTVKIADFQEVDLPDDTTACDGVPIILDSGMDYMGFLWNTGATTRTITAVNPGLYYVTVNNYGCPDSDSVYVQHFPKPPPTSIYHD
jgi:hypothetical protein